MIKLAIVHFKYVEGMCDGRIGRIVESTCMVGIFIRSIDIFYGIRYFLKWKRIWFDLLIQIHINEEKNCNSEMSKANVILGGIEG
jgi:hypothetical protein